jgi:hypothetical protein
MEEVNKNTEVDNTDKKLNISDVMFQFLTKIENEDKLKNILIEKNWFMGSLDDDINKQCQCYRKDGKIFFKNYDGNVYELDLIKFSQFLVKN